MGYVITGPQWILPRMAPVKNAVTFNVEVIQKFGDC